MFLFIVLINLVGFGNQNKQVGITITKPLQKRKPMEKIHLKYIDDLTVAQSLSLKKQLIQNSDTDKERPLDFHNRTEHILPKSENRIQDMLEEVVDYAEAHKMKVNHDKSKVILFNSSKKFDFMPQLSLEPGINLNLVESFQLLGVIVQSNLKWDQNTDYICTKAYERIWMIRRLKLLGASSTELVDVYNKQVRSVLEMAVVVWNPALTKHQVAQIERVQKTVCAIIMGASYLEYNCALTELELQPLSERRKQLCTSFAKKSYKNEKYNSWFVPRSNLPTVHTRSEKSALLCVPTRTKRSKLCPLPFLAKLLNDCKKF